MPITLQFLEALLLTALYASALTFLLAFFQVTTVARKNFERKRDFFKQYPVVPGDIVMAGDSLTDLGLWDELLPGLPVKNRGISAETSKGLLRRMGDITCGHPAAIFILIGTNDLPWYMLRTVEAILKTYAAIIERIQIDSPETHIYIQSILPRRWWYLYSIHRLNHGLRSLSLQYGCTYIDLYTPFATLNGVIRPEYTNDKLHLMAAGYAHWAELIKPYIEDFQSKDSL